MILGRVIGNIWSTRKNERLTGLKFMVVERLDHQENSTQDTFIAADNVGAGVGDTVIVVTGSAARVALEQEIPVDSTIVGIVDSVEQE
ncbi:ethanolamine utilization protein EutN [Pilibacter termitis]|uniref:Ethanolamine utilization protein EutN n=1 Tax=Pilibacter termitis TaxID=263852 RepID=A0A1T4K5R6_9ENTE|nr:EutN/CcmL family microcompartment protein [Pilibacter termitis]SJZ37774.1 ethanolamine utilization protein EutN [Pilibacter termitis]